MYDPPSKEEIIKNAKSCPFCGSLRLLAGYKYCIICVDCGATGPENAKIGKALLAWNSRKIENSLDN